MKIAKKFTDLFSDALWTIDTAGCTAAYRRLVRFVKLCRITINTFFENKMGFQCVALSYFVTLAIIPFVAFLFAITGGLGISNLLSDALHQFMPTYPELIDTVMDKANNILDVVKGGGVGIISALLFFWAVLWMMFQVERVFNNVWGISRIPRKIYKRFGFYLIVLIITPFILIVFGTGIAFYTNLTNLFGIDLSDISFLPKLLFYLGFYIFCVLTLSVMYKFIPATSVRYRFALKSALLTAAFFSLFQYLYLETQMFMGRLNMAYGVIAAVPLFLIWLNFDWQIIIYGAELTYGYQNVDKYNIPEWESEDKKQ